MDDFNGLSVSDFVDKKTFEIEDVSIEAELLSPTQRVLADKLIGMVVEYLGGLNFVSGKLAKMIAKRLMEKLELASLPEDAIGDIAEGVWSRLNEMGNGERQMVNSQKQEQAEQKIVDDIMARLEGKFFLVKGLWESMVIAIGPDASGKVIRTVAREVWPKAKKELGI